jgi:hypothetical protein
MKFFSLVLLFFGSIAGFTNEPYGYEQKYGSQEADIEVVLYRQEGIIPYLTTMYNWAVREFGQAPYLYAPPKEHLVSMSDLLLINSPKAALALAKKEGKIVGLVSFISFDAAELHSAYFTEHDLLKKMRSSGFDPSRMLYVSSFLTAPEYHNDPAVVDALYATMINAAYEQGKSQLCYMEDIGYAPTKIEPWGVVIQNCKSTNIQVDISWPTKQGNSSKELPHTLEFFVHNLL